MDLLLLSTFPLPILDRNPPWLNSRSCRAGKVDVGSLYFPRAGTLRATDTYGLVLQSAQMAARIFRKQACRLKSSVDPAGLQ
jgi:hypothetical protein